MLQGVQVLLEPCSASLLVAGSSFGERVERE